MTLRTDTVDHQIMQGDRQPSFSYTLRDAHGVPVTLPATATVKLKLRNRATLALKIDVLAAVVAAGAASPALNAGVVRYDWGAADTDTPGFYLGQWEVTYLGGSKSTFPSGDYLVVEVLSDLG